VQDRKLFQSGVSPKVGKNPQIMSNHNTPYLWFHWTRLLWLNGFTDRALIVAHRSRSAQGRVHFITTMSMTDVA